MKTDTSEVTKMYFWRSNPSKDTKLWGLLKLRPELYFLRWISDDTKNAE